MVSKSAMTCVIDVSQSTSSDLRKATGETHPKSIQPSSARRRQCSHACRTRSMSTVPPKCPCASDPIAVSQVLTTKLVLASKRYGCPEVYAV